VCEQVFLTQHYLAIAMEFAAGGDMFEHVVKKGGLKESEARWFFQQLIVGVDYVHKMVRQPRLALQQWIAPLMRHLFF
jgi:serine/threonine-protein kinase SRK2